ALPHLRFTTFKFHLTGRVSGSVSGKQGRFSSATTPSRSPCFESITSLHFAFHSFPAFSGRQEWIFLSDGCRAKHGTTIPLRWKGHTSARGLTCTRIKLVSSRLRILSSESG